MIGGDAAYREGLQCDGYRAHHQEQRILQTSPLALNRAFLTVIGDAIVAARRSFEG